MRYAVFSDVHANRQAWDTVLADIRQQGADVLVCLGDVVGYGPMPQEVLESVGAVTPNFVLGNHDAAVCGRLDTSFFNPSAKEVIEWTRGRLDKTALEFFEEVPLQIEEGDILFVHAEAANPGRFGYIDDETSAAESLEAIEQRIAFLGHTHHPLVHEMNEGTVRELPPMDFKLQDGRRYLVNVGSVGEPRTPDIRSSYVIYDADAQTVAFRQLTFDVEAYRRDLAASGLQIQPYFVQVVEYGEQQAAAARQTAMVLKPNVPVVETTRRPLLMTGQASPWMSGAGGANSAADYYRTIQAQQRRSRVISGALILLLILGMGAGAVFFLMDKGENGDNLATNETADADVTVEPKDDVAPGELGPEELIQKHYAGETEEPEAVDAEPLDSALVSYWPFDGGGLGTSHGNFEASGKIEGDIIGVEGRFGDAFHFVSGSIEVDDKDTYAIGDGSFSVALWFTLPSETVDASPVESRLVSAGAGAEDTRGWAIWLNGETLCFAVSNGEERKYIRVPGIVREEAEQWRHLAVVVERSLQKALVYVDGELAEEALLTVLASGELRSASGLSIGRSSDGGNHFKGKIDDLGIWARALPDWEVRALVRKRKAIGDLLGASSTASP